MKTLKLNDPVLVISTNSIGFIIDKGNDNLGEWYRTDCDGIREIEDMIKITSEYMALELIDEGAILAPSIKQKLNTYFN